MDNLHCEIQVSEGKSKYKISRKVTQQILVLDQPVL